MDESLKSKLIPGAKVKVTQQIAARNHTWTNQITGTILKFEQKKTGSWFAHSKADKLWLDRLLVQRSDGELMTLNLDAYSQVEITEEAKPTAGAGK